MTIMVEYHGGEEPRVGVPANTTVIIIDWKRIGDDRTYAILTYNMLYGLAGADPLFPRASRAQDMIVEIWGGDLLTEAKEARA